MISRARALCSRLSSSTLRGTSCISHSTPRSTTTPFLHAASTPSVRSLSMGVGDGAAKPRGGLVKDVEISGALADIVGGTRMSRLEITRRLWAYSEFDSERGRQDLHLACYFGTWLAAALGCDTLRTMILQAVLASPWSRGPLKVQE